MSTTRRKFSKEFKVKVVLESLKERVTLEVLAKKYELTPYLVHVGSVRIHDPYFYCFINLNVLLSSFPILRK